MRACSDQRGTLLLWLSAHAQVSALLQQFSIVESRLAGTVDAAFKAGADEVISFESEKDAWYENVYGSKYWYTDKVKNGKHHVIVPGGHQDEFRQIEVKDACWQRAPARGWHIVVDEDEWVDVTDEELAREHALGASVLAIQGFQMVGRASTTDLSDLDVHGLTRGYPTQRYSKRCLVFNSQRVSALAMTVGAHNCTPQGLTKAQRAHYSQRAYSMRHMKELGYAYSRWRSAQGHARNGVSRTLGMNSHYFSTSEKHTKLFDERWRYETEHPHIVDDYRVYMVNLTRAECMQRGVCR